MVMQQLFEVGDTLYGYCNGYFGRDDYDTKVCIMVTSKYAVFEYDNGNATILNAGDLEGISVQEVDIWKMNNDEE